MKKSLFLLLFSMLFICGCSTSTSGSDDSFDSNSSADEVNLYSSSVTFSSSEFDLSSSSIALNYSEAYFVDERDQNVYKITTIGTQTWMAENLKYETEYSACYASSADSCEKYGRSYTWCGAMNLGSGYSFSYYGAYVDPPYQGVCPVGWHIPDSTEWNLLISFVDENNGEESVGNSLKSKTGWGEGLAGSDRFGFRVIAAPPANPYTAFNENYTGFISSSEYSGNPTGFHAYQFSEDIVPIGLDKDMGFDYFVRCIKDE